MLVRWMRSDRPVGLVIALSGVAVSLGTLNDLLSQWTRFTPWWSATALLLVLLTAALSVTTHLLPRRLLRGIWATAPLVLLLLLAVCALAWRGGSALPAPWVWRLDTPLVMLFALVARPLLTFALIGILAAAPSLSALVFLGAAPAALHEQSWIHAGVVAFVAILLSLRHQLSELESTEADAWGTQSEEALARVSASDMEEFALVTHDEVLSTFAAGTRFDGPPPDRLRQEAQHAIDALAAAGTGSRTETAGGLSAEEAGGLLARLVERVAPDQGVAIDAAGPGRYPERTVATIGLATAEATRNAVRHAAGVSVRVQIGEPGIEVLVADTGRGFRLRGVDERRLGVRRSILGRMNLLPGGKASIRSSRSGTEVRITWRR